MAQEKAFLDAHQKLLQTLQDEKPRFARIREHTEQLKRDNAAQREALNTAQHDNATPLSNFNRQ
jgi:hypothetical protein